MAELRSTVLSSRLRVLALALLAVLAIPARAQLSQEQLLLLMQSPTAQATLMQLQANNAATQATVASQSAVSSKSAIADSSLFLYPDTALAVPALMAKLDSLDSLVHADSIPLRYERRIFRGEQSSLFSSTTSMVGGDYPLKGGDVLSITIYGSVEKQIEAAIGPDGSTTIEMAGRVSLGGKTLEAATAAIKQALGRSISGLNSGSTQISVTLASLSPIKVFMLGEVEVPGGYVFHGNTNILLALYLARGPSPLGSVRRMQLIRDGKSTEVDLYEYLFRGNMADSGGVLHDGDVVVLPRAEALVEVRGDVGREAMYELKEGEGMRELLFYASGLNPTAADQSAVVERLLEGGRRDYLTIEPARTYVDSAAAPYPLQDGDIVHVPRTTLDPKDNVTVLGAVRYPATYQFAEGMTLEAAIAAAGGPREDAYSGRVQVLRSTPTGQLHLFSQDLAQGMALEPSDTLIVYSQRELATSDSVAISGAVPRPGSYPYYEGMTVKDLVLMAGGFLPGREKGKLRLERRTGERSVEVVDVDIQDDYEANDLSLTLRPYDRLAVPVDPSWYAQEVVSLRGFFRRPGQYALAKSGERLKELLDRVDGFQPEAYLGGARFFRKTTAWRPLVEGTEINGYDTVGVYPVDSTFQIGLDLRKALDGDEEHNIALQHGDSIWLPRNQASVKVWGEVGAPSDVLWRAGEDPEYYIARAGGLTRRSDPKHLYVVYANGEKATVGHLPRDPDPGSQIYVPPKSPPPETDWLRILASVASILSSFAAVALAISEIND